MFAGMLLLGVQLLYLSTLGLGANFWNLLPAMIVGGFGMALTMTPSAAAAVRSVPVDKSGVGSAVLNSFRQVGGSIGIALMGAIVAHSVGQQRSPEAFVDGFQNALVVAALIAFAGAVVSAVLVRMHDVEEHGPAEAVHEVAA
jgi:MFS family permease